MDVHRDTTISNCTSDTEIHTLPLAAVSEIADEVVNDIINQTVMDMNNVVCINESVRCVAESSDSITNESNIGLLEQPYCASTETIDHLLISTLADDTPDTLTSTNERNISLGGTHVGTESLTSLSQVDQSQTSIPVDKDQIGDVKETQQNQNSFLSSRSVINALTAAEEKHESKLFESVNQVNILLLAGQTHEPNVECSDQTTEEKLAVVEAADQCSNIEPIEPVIEISSMYVDLKVPSPGRETVGDQVLIDPTEFSELKQLVHHLQLMLTTQLEERERLQASNERLGAQLVVAGVRTSQDSKGVVRVGAGPPEIKKQTVKLGTAAAEDVAKLVVVSALNNYIFGQ